MPADVTRWRYGHRDADALAAHLVDTRDRRRHRRLAAVGAAYDEVLHHIVDGVPLREACERAGVTPSIVHGRARWDEAWRARLDGALMTGRDWELPHGTEMAYRRGRCRCPECREAHRVQAARTPSERARGARG